MNNSNSTPTTQNSTSAPKDNSFFADLWLFLKSQLFLKNVILAVIMVVLLLGMVSWFLNVYTRHNDQFPVPDFTGRTLLEVQNLCNENDLEFKVIDSVYGGQGRRGTVVEQTPKPNFEVKEDRTVFVTIKAFTPEMTKMPNITGISLVQAKADLQISGLEIGKLIYIASEYQNLVLNQQIKGKNVAPGVKIEKGTVVDIVLGRGTEGAGTVTPKLLGLRRREALDRAIEQSLNLTVVEYDKSVVTYNDSLNARVWKQEPKFRTELGMGSAVKIWLTIQTQKVNISLSEVDTTGTE